MSEIIKGAMRIGGKDVSTDAVVNVHYPYTNAIIGTVPAGRAEHAREAFRIAANYKPKLTRYERQKISITCCRSTTNRFGIASDPVVARP